MLKENCVVKCSSAVCHVIQHTHTKLLWLSLRYIYYALLQSYDYNYGMSRILFIILLTIHYSINLMTLGSMICSNDYHVIKTFCNLVYCELETLGFS